MKKAKSEDGLISTTLLKDIHINLEKNVITAFDFIFRILYENKRGYLCITQNKTKK